MELCGPHVAVCPAIIRSSNDDCRFSHDLSLVNTDEPTTPGAWEGLKSRTMGSAPSSPERSASPVDGLVGGVDGQPMLLPRGRTAGGAAAAKPVSMRRVASFESLTSAKQCPIGSAPNRCLPPTMPCPYHGTVL